MKWYRKWIRSLGLSKYKLSDMNEILADLKNEQLINLVILYNKVCIYSQRITRWETTFLTLKNLLYRLYLQKKYAKTKSTMIFKVWSKRSYFAYIIDKQQTFDSRQHLYYSFVYNFIARISYYTMDTVYSFTHCHVKRYLQ